MQKTMCMSYNLDKVTPKLHQLGVILKGTKITETDSSCISSYINDIEALTAQLKHLLDDPSSPTFKTDRKVTANIECHITLSQNTKQSSKTIIGPLPEKASI